MKLREQLFRLAKLMSMAMGSGSFIAFILRDRTLPAPHSVESLKCFFLAVIAAGVCELAGRSTDED